MAVVIYASVRFKFNKTLNKLDIRQQPQQHTTLHMSTEDEL